MGYDHNHQTPDDNCGCYPNAVGGVEASVQTDGIILCDEGNPTRFRRGIILLQQENPSKVC
jgi:hypothetical protein